MENPRRREAATRYDTETRKAKLRWLWLLRYSAPMKPVETIITELLTKLGVPFTKVERSIVAGQEIYSIRTEGEARALIGVHGDTVHALDFLVKRMYERGLGSQSEQSESGASEVASLSRSPMFMVDVNDYRLRQLKELETKALMMAERARSFQYDVELSPMSAYERLIVHTALQGAPNVKTESHGEGRSRRVVIKYSAE